MKLRRTGCSCDCFIEVENYPQVGQKLGENTTIKKVKVLKSGQLRVEVNVYLESSCNYKDDEIRRDSYQSIETYFSNDDSIADQLTCP